MHASEYSPCVTRSGKPRRGYYDLASAEDGVDYVMDRYGKDMVPYLCENCDEWHLCPAKRHTPSQHCDPCAKQLYESEQAARRRGRILQSERRISLRLYKCPKGNGWHLTSMQPEAWEELSAAQGNREPIIPSQPV
jgi:hypothetical protein